MRTLLIGTAALALAACNTSSPPPETKPANSSWVSDQLWQIFDAQDRRDLRVLTELAHDQRDEVRARAVLALASVGDKAAVPVLLNALTDADPAVRTNAAFAFGFCGDSASVHQLMERYSPEATAVVRARMAEAAGRCGGRAGADLLLRRSMSTKGDTLGVLRGLYFATANGRTDTAHVGFALRHFTGRTPIIDEAALQVCSRSKADLVKPFAKRLLALPMATQSTDVMLPWLSALGKCGDKQAVPVLTDRASNAQDPLIRVMALQALERIGRDESEVTVWRALQDPSSMVRDKALEIMLAWKGPIDASSAWVVAQEHADYRVKIPLYGLVMKYGDPDTKRMCGMLLESTAKQDLGPYVNASLLNARCEYDRQDTLVHIMLHSPSAVMKQAAFALWLKNDSERLLHVEIDQEAHQRYHSAFMRQAITSGDAGLVAAACEYMLEQPATYIQRVLDPEAIGAARSSLLPIRDLESIQNLEACIAKRDGKPKPAHVSPPFNHPIDRVRLGALDPQQRYVVSTELGDIVIAIEADAAPGSALAFDSLVTAGYYNNKYIHRVVPDFVAQGGCPRGDGYGGMDWTLRTEIGLDGFTTGAIGLASAGKDTEGCQFFFMLAHAPHLDGRYTRFAHVESGMEVVWQLRVGDRITAIKREVR